MNAQIFRAFWLRVAGAVLLVSALSSHAWADGKVLSTGRAIPAMPEQAAIIYWADGVETLAIESVFERVSGSAGEPAAEYAWILPVPAAKGPPKLLPITPGTLPTARALFAVPVRDQMPWHLFPFWLAFAGTAAAMRLGSDREVRLGGAVLLCVAALGLPFVLLSGASLGGERASASLVVHERTMVGSLDVAVLGLRQPALPDAGSPASAQPVLTWLDANGFRVPVEVGPVLDDYAKEGWCFIATRLAPGQPADARLAPAPLAVRFASDQAIYPMRLTGAGVQGPLTVDLYVFGDQMAAAAGFRRVRCIPAHRRTEADSVRVRPGWVPIAHEGLRNLIPESCTAAHLRATLSPADMQRDIAITWRKPERQTAMRHAWPVILAHAAQACMSAFGVLMLGVLVLARVRPTKQLRLRRCLLVACVISAGVGMLPFVLFSPHAGPLSSSRQSYREADRLVKALVERFPRALNARRGPDATVAAPPSIDEVRAFTREFLTASAASPPDLTEPRPPMREEDSPGNYTVDEGVHGWPQLRFYSESGAAEVLWPW